MVVGAIKYGDYKVILDSPYALGRVRVNVIDLAEGVDQPELEQIDEVEETTEETDKE